jgi:hypothetical protein
MSLTIPQSAATALRSMLDREPGFKATIAHVQYAS